MVSLDLFWYEMKRFTFHSLTDLQFEGSKKYTKNIARRTVEKIVKKLRKTEDEKTHDENIEKGKTLVSEKIQKKQTKKLMKQDEPVLKTPEKKTIQEMRQRPIPQNKQTKKLMKQDKFVLKTPGKKTTQECDELKEMKQVFEKEFNYKSKKEDETNVMNENEEKHDGNESEKDKDVNESEIPEDGKWMKMRWIGIRVMYKIYQQTK
ncbi:unnamed protein product [Lactuca virosa]|uniref:Uncharacterized protein n=1 Tax=Lactuca virosa TaxID=75947 RepID=A0AAU9N2A2_9ASTR|nr:unnamed protein product [Lactuca virosa]